MVNIDMFQALIVILVDFWRFGDDDFNDIIKFKTMVFIVVVVVFIFLYLRQSSFNLNDFRRDEDEEDMGHEI